MASSSHEAQILEQHRLEVGEEADSTSNTTTSIIARLGGLVGKAGMFVQVQPVSQRESSALLPA